MPTDGEILFDQLNKKVNLPLEIWNIIALKTPLTPEAYYEKSDIFMALFPKINVDRFVLNNVMCICGIGCHSDSKGCKASKHVPLPIFKKKKRRSVRNGHKWIPRPYHKSTIIDCICDIKRKVDCDFTSRHNCVCTANNVGYIICKADCHRCVCAKGARNACKAPLHKCICIQDIHNYTERYYRDDIQNYNRCLYEGTHMYYNQNLKSELEREHMLKHIRQKCICMETYDAVILPALHALPIDFRDRLECARKDGTYVYEKCPDRIHKVNNSICITQFTCRY